MITSPAHELSLIDLLVLEQLGTDVLRSVATFTDGEWLYGGLVLGRAPGDDAHRRRRVRRRLAARLLPARWRRGAGPRFEVTRDHDGRSYAARRAVARQGDEVIFTLNASFHVGEKDRTGSGRCYRLGALRGSCGGTG